MRFAAPLLVAILTGCIGFGGCRPSFPPLAIEQTGHMMTDPDGGPRVECRDLAATHCEIGFHVVDDPRPVRPFDEIDRIVVSCVGTCTAQGGETRVDIVFLDGTSEVYANSGYGEFEQSCA